MSASPHPALLPVRFGIFELDQKAGELRKNGSKLRVEGQPLQILAVLLDTPGEVVTRDELRQKLWANDTNVDFEHGINTGIRRLREALGDSAETPRFIQTLPRRGYRFIYPLSPAVVPTPIPQRARARLAGTLGAVAIVVTAAAAISVYFSRSSPLYTQVSSLAVLPLANLSGDSEQEYFADAMTDELITSISKIPRLRVISRTSVMQYKRTNKPLPTIARELNVDGLIEGTVLRSGDRVRITIQLLHGPSDTHLWAETYERDLRDILTLQDELADAVAHQVRVALTSSEQQSQREHNRSLDPKAYELYLKGRYYFANRQTEKAAASFSKAIELQPDYAQAYAGLAESYDQFEAQNAAPPRQAISNAKAAALRALEIDDNVAEAHASLGWAKMVYDWDWAGAETEFKRAVQLNPSYETGHLWYGCELVWEGRFEEGLAEMKRAQEVAPASALMAGFFGMGLYQARRYGEAIERSKDALELDSTFPAAHQWLGLTYVALGRHEEAISELEKSLRFSKEQGVRMSVALSRLGYAYGVAGHRTEALAILEQLRTMAVTKHVPPSHFAVVYIGMGDKDRAFYWLNRGFRERSYEMTLIKSDPRFDSLRNDPRFSGLLEGMNFPK